VKVAAPISGVKGSIVGTKELGRERRSILDRSIVFVSCSPARPKEYSDWPIRLIAILTVLMMLLLAGVSLIWTSVDEKIGVPLPVRTDAFTPHVPIYITSNSQFATMADAEGWHGSGTQSDPYIIEEYDIDGGYGTYCISISGTTVFFHIRDCWLRQAMGYPDGSGVKLSDVQHAVVENCTIERCAGYGLRALSSEDIAFRNNTCRWVALGLYFSICYSILYPSLKSSILNNTCEDGISSGGLLVYGVSVYATDYVTVEGNNVDNFATNGIVTSSTSHAVFSNNTISRCGTGINSSSSNSGNLLADNTVTNCTYGIYLGGRSNISTVVRNRIENSTSYGIFVTVQSGWNLICDNHLILNNAGGRQARDDVGMNRWNSTTGGNWWSDWTEPDDDMNGIVDVPYDLDGVAGAKDYYPLTIPQTPIPEFGSTPLLVVVFLTLILLTTRARRRSLR
jgi:parallel beta-helix repeat protein